MKIKLAVMAYATNDFMRGQVITLASPEALETPVGATYQYGKYVKIANREIEFDETPQTIEKIILDAHQSVVDGQLRETQKALKELLAKQAELEASSAA